MSQSNPISTASGVFLLNQRRSVPSRQLGEPGPDDDTLMQILWSAIRVPDHGCRVPFRFLRLAGDARSAFGHMLAERTQSLRPDAPDAVLDKERGRFNHAPLVVTVIARLPPDAKIPESERFSSASCVCFALLQAAQAHGFGAQWLTGWAAYDPVITKVLGLDKDERVVGFIHIGTARSDVPERERPDPRDLLSDWTPS